jgi:hypothetical protein
MNDDYEQNDSGQDLPEEPSKLDTWLELFALAGLGLVAFFIVYTWAK